MVKVNPVIDLKPEKILFNRVKGPVFFLQLEPCLKLIDGYIDRDSKTDVGADHRSHQPFGVFLKVFAKTDDISL